MEDNNHYIHLHQTHWCRLSSPGELLPFSSLNFSNTVFWHFLLVVCIPGKSIWICDSTAEWDEPWQKPMDPFHDLTNCMFQKEMADSLEMGDSLIPATAYRALLLQLHVDLIKGPWHHESSNTKCLSDNCEVFCFVNWSSAQWANSIYFPMWPWTFCMDNCLLCTDFSTKNRCTTWFACMEWSVALWANRPFENSGLDKSQLTAFISAMLIKRRSNICPPLPPTFLVHPHSRECKTLIISCYMVC